MWTGAILATHRRTALRLSDVALISGLAICEPGPEELRPLGPEDPLFFTINTFDDYARAIDLDANS
jgi:hypothetical protein